MYISQKLRKENIAEYLLYMWQVEDIIRACGCDEERIKSEYLSKFGLKDDDERKYEEWFANLCRMMRSEGVVESGHLQINKNVIAALDELSQRMLESPKFGRYHQAFYKALPDIMELRRKGNGSKVSDVEVCFNALYGIMLLKMQKKEVSEGTANAVKEISALVGLLAAYYKKDKESPLKFDDSDEVM